MPWVTVQPAGIQLEVELGESVAEAAWRQGFRWPTQCYGQIDCMSCFTKILDGELAAIPADDVELDAMRLKMSKAVRGDLVRLGCQLKVKGDGLVLHKAGFRPEQPGDNNMLNTPSSTAQTTNA